MTAHDFLKKKWIDENMPYLVATEGGSSASAPDAPVLSFVSNTDTTIVVSWPAVSGATSYKVYRDGVLISSSATSPYTFTGLTGSTSYALTAKATNSSGDSVVSNTITKTTDATIPAGYTAWLAAASAVANPTNTDKAAVSALLTSMAANGFLLADFDYIYLMIGGASGDTATQRYNQKRINLVNPGTFDATIINPNASGHLAGGTQGNNFMYWSTGLSAATRLVNRTNNSSWGALYYANSAGGGSIPCEGGWEDGANTSYLQGNYSSGTRSYIYYGGSGSPAISPVISGPCLYYSNDVSNTHEVFVNATSKGTGAAGLKTLGATVPDTVFSAGASYYRSEATLAMRWHGRSFNSTERTNWYAMWQTFMAAYSVTF